MNKENKIMIIIIAAAIMIVIGATFSVWVWSTNNTEKTNVVFTVTPEFSCSADGGGNLTSNDKMLAPAACTNTTYAIQRTITVRPTLSANVSSIYLDLWLNVNQIGSGLSATSNMKYALTTSPTNCQTGVVAEGNFYGATTNSQKTLLNEKAYSSTTPDTYYLWIWLDAAEESDAAQNQTFNIELGGSCTDEMPNYVYTVNTNGSVTIGQAIPNTITQYTTPEAAMAAFGNRPFFLRHRIQNDVVSESYVGFVVTPTMAGANTGMTAGTYYLRGGIDESSLTTKPVYEANKAVLQSAFGASSGYCSENSSNFNCGVSNLNPTTTVYGTSFVSFGDYKGAPECKVLSDGTSYCSG